MSRFISLTLLLLALAGSTFGQKDPKATAALDKFSASASKAPSVTMKFLLITIDQAQNSTDTVSGSILLCKDSYKLELPNNIIWFNGEDSWSYLPAEDEVTITRPDKKDNSFQAKPSLIFTMYKTGYKQRLIEEKSDSWTIDLYPEDLKNELVRARLVIARPSLNLKSFEYKRKDGVIITLNVQEYNLTQVPAAGAFVFPSGKYKNADVVDMR